MAASATNDGRPTRPALRSMFSRKNRSVRTRLIACFVLIALLMIAADAVAVWRFSLIPAVTERLGNADETSLAVLRVHFDIDTFRDSVDLFAGSHDARQFTTEVTSIRQKFLHDVDYAQHLASNGFDAPDATITTSLESLRVTFLSQLDSAVELATAGEWSLLRLRLTTQVPALMEYSSSLVDRVDQRVSELRTKAVEEKQRAQQHLIAVVSLVGLLTLLSAGALGWYVTNAISAPLSELTACAQSLAQGNFQNQVNVRGDDEFTVLGKAFNYAALQLQRLYDNLRRSEQELRDVIDAVPVHAWSAVPNGDVDFVNQRWQKFTGLPAERAFGWNWEAVLHPDDRAKFIADWRAALDSGQAMETAVRVRRVDGEYRCLLVRNVPLRDERGNIVKWYGTGLDIEDRQRAESLLAGEKRILEMIVKGDSLAEILDSLCWFAEEQGGGALASIFLLEHNRLRRGAAPSLPKAYMDAVDGTLIGPLAGSCGTAAYRGDQVIAEDIATDPLWADHRDLALPHGLRACWSTPVFSSERKVIATFALYYREPRRLGSSHQEIIEQITHLAGVAIERKLAQDALQRSETYLSEAQRLSHTGSWAYNPAKHQPTYWSAEMFRMCGFDPQQGPPTGDAFLERVPPEDRERVHVVFYNAMQEKTEYEDEHRIIFPDGTIKHIHSIGHPVLNRSGEVVEFVGSAVDVTDRKRAEEALRRSEAYLAEAQRLTHTGSLAWDPIANRWLYWSEEMFRIFGFDPHDGIPTNIDMAKRIHPEDLEYVMSSTRQKSDYVVNHRIILPDGTVRQIESTGHPVLDASGEPVEYIGASMDVTERKHAEEALRRSESYLAQAQKLSHTGSWAWRVESRDSLHTGGSTTEGVRGMFAHLSEEWYRIYGFDPADGIPTWEERVQRLHPEDRARWKSTVDRALAEKSDYDVELRIILPGGVVRYIHTVGHPVLDASGGVGEFVGITMDVTERRRADQERETLRQAQADLARISRVSTMGELTASLAHEIKQPISAAVTDAETCLLWLDRDHPDLAEARETALRIIKDVTRASEIINRIGLLFKKGSQQRELIDLNEVIQEMVALLHSEAARYSISMQCDLANDLSRALGDRVQLQQVLMNLMLNGLEAMKDMQTAGELTIKSRQDDNRQLLISVGDTGVGLQPGQAEQIFDAFFTTKPQGTGMGLAISRSIVESHGGRLWVTPNPGRGTTFQFSLPGEVSTREAA